MEPTAIKKCVHDLNKVDNKTTKTTKFYYS